MLRGIRQRLTFSNVVALLALFFALGGSSLAEPARTGARQLITGKDIASSVVTGRHVADGSLRSADVRNNALGARDLGAGVAATDVLGTARFRAGGAVGPARTSCNIVGQVVLFGGNLVPAGTLPARGQLLPISQNTALFSVYGTKFGGDGQTTFALPDLRGAEPKGQGGQPVGYLVCLAANPGASGICDWRGEVVLFGGDRAPAGTLPARGQLLPLAQNFLLYSIYGNRFGGDDRTTFALPDLRGAEPKGQGGQPVGYLVCVDGVYPARGPIRSCDPLGQVVLFGGNFAPAGTQPARGQVLHIDEWAEWGALFAIFGTKFGGNGQSTFELPDLRGAEPTGLGGQPVGYLVCVGVLKPEVGPDDD